MTTIPDLNELRRIAEAATPGPWVLDSLGADEPEINVWERRFIATAEPDDRGVHHVVAESEDGHGSDAKYITTFDPPTVLALLDQLKRLEGIGRIASFEARRADAAERERDSFRSAIQEALDVVHSGSVPLGVTEARHYDRLLAESRRILTEALEASRDHG